MFQGVEQERTVLLSQLGLLGSSPMSSPSWLLLKPNSSQALNKMNNDEYGAKRNSSLVLQMRTNLLLSASSTFFSFSAGFDNRRLLPPFLPAGRNSDGVFGWRVKAVYPESVTAFEPYIVLHSNSKRCSYGPDEIWQGCSRIRISDLVLLSLQFNEHKLKGIREPVNRLFEIGGWLSALADFERKNFLSFLLERVCFLLEDRLKRLRALKSELLNNSSLLLEDVNSAINCVESGLRNPHSLIMKGCAAEIPCEDRMERLQGIIKLFGEVICSWNRISEAVHANFIG
jgi:hypothetical protein